MAPMAGTEMRGEFILASRFVTCRIQVDSRKITCATSAIQHTMSMVENL